MSIRRQAIGTAGTPFELRVEYGKIREFARATFSEDSSYLRLSPPPTIPATFLFTAPLWQRGAADPWSALGFDLRRALHGEHEYVFYGPPPVAGDVLEGRAYISDVTTKMGRRGGEMTIAVITTDYYDVDGTRRVTSRMTCIETAADASSDTQS
jgi:hypothetical protein